MSPLELEPYSTSLEVIEKNLTLEVYPTDITRADVLALLDDEIDALVFADIGGTIAPGQVPAAAVTQHEAALAIAWGQITATPTTLAGYGITDAASDAELLAHTANVANPHAVTKAQVGLGSVQDTALSTWAGSANIVTLGTVTAGSFPAANLTGTTLAANVVTSSLTSVGALTGLTIRGTTGLRIEGTGANTDTIDMVPGFASTFDRLDFKAVGANRGVQFQLHPHGTSTNSKLALANASSQTDFGSVFLSVAGVTAYVSSQTTGVGTPVTDLVFGGGTSAANWASVAFLVTGGVTALALTAAGATIAALAISGGLTYSAARFDITPNTADAADTKGAALLGGGGLSVTRGGYVSAYGNEHATLAGKVIIIAGSGANVEITGTQIALTGNVSLSSNLNYSAARFDIVPDTADGADTKGATIMGGGGLSVTRGGYVAVYGNEHATLAGKVLVTAGTGMNVDITGSQIALIGAVSVASISGNLMYSAARFDISANTSDAADTKAVAVAGGGSVSVTRGAYFIVHGNEHATFPGKVLISGGNSQGVTIGGGTLTVENAIAIGNTLNAVSPTAPNRTITMVVNGTTVYIPAKLTND